MPTLKFLPEDKSIEVESNTKLLAAAVKNKIKIRYGCGACRCGTCAVEVRSQAPLAEVLSPMENNELELLSSMKLPTDGRIRLACQARVRTDTVEVDIDFQKKYSPDDGLFEKT